MSVYSRFMRPVIGIPPWLAEGGREAGQRDSLGLHLAYAEAFEIAMQVVRLDPDGTRP